MLRRKLLGLGLLAVLGRAGAALAQSADPGFRNWLQGLKAEAVGKGVSSKTLGKALDGIEQVPEVLELYAHQPEFKMSFQEYQTLVVSEKRVKQGREMLAKHRALLSRFSSLYGVPQSLIVALWGIESNYGERQGDFLVVPALATLAYNGKRVQFFRGELIAALRIIDQGHIGATEMKGSWAGALGQCQFIPSSFLAYAADGDGDGHNDIWNNTSDVFASIANYMHRAGWRSSENWGKDVTGQPTPTTTPGNRIVRPAGASGPTFLVTRNFATILRWNQSDFFALSVGLLSDRISAP